MEAASGQVGPLMKYFSGIPDPRKETNKKYPLDEVVAITILAVLSFAAGWEDIERYGKAKKEWLSKYMELKEGIPKHDVYRRVFSVLCPELLEKGCQYEIANKIIKKKADYLFSLKGNQGNLHEDVKEYAD